MNIYSLHYQFNGKYICIEAIITCETNVTNKIVIMNTKNQWLEQIQKYLQQIIVTPPF